MSPRHLYLLRALFTAGVGGKPMLTRCGTRATSDALQVVLADPAVFRAWRRTY